MNDLAKRIAELWSDEWCEWRLDYRDDAVWVCSLTWTAEYYNPLEADWAKYTWEFPDESPEGAMRDACHWLEALAFWRRCDACDGQGSWGSPPVRCEDCDGSGLHRS